MLKGLFIVDDNFLLERIKTGFNDYSGYEYLFASTSEEAVSLAKDNDIAICCLYLNMEILSGDEIADIVIDENPEVRFIFIYDEKDTELAVNMFNTYDGSKIILKDNFSVENLKELFDEESKLYNAENKLHEDAKLYREREKAYKNSMSEMSNVLNQRVECYQSIVKLYTAGIEMVMPKFTKDEALKVKAFFEKEFSEYIDKFVVDSLDVSSFFENLEAQIGDTENQKHFLVIGKESVKADELGSLICYMIHFISHGFCDFLEKYRTKVEIKEGPFAVRIDFLIDTRLGNVRKEFFDEYVSILNDIVVTLCDKVEKGSKDGITQYRFFYLKESSSDSEENEGLESI